jgi:hypothetical protein
MPPSDRPGRNTKGTGLVELVKVLRIHRHQQPLEGLGARGRALVDERILPNEWYPLEGFLDLLDFAYTQLLGRDDQATLQMGVAGGRVLLQGPHRAFIKPGDPSASVHAMRHTWPAYYDFGSLSAEPEGDSTVRFELTGYPDVPAPHAMMIAGWPIAAAQLSGAADARCEMLERPWRGGGPLAYRVVWSPG